MPAKPPKPHLVQPPAPEIETTTLERSIGRQIRASRLDMDLTASAIAAVAGISASMLSKIENGQISASLGTLQRIAKALNLPLTRLLTTYEEMHDCSYVPAGTGLQMERRGTKAGHHYRLLGHCLAGDISVDPYLITLSQDAIPFTGFQHEGIELIYMLTGSVAYRHGDQTYRLAPGDTLMFDASAVHGPVELLSLPASYLSIISFQRS